jgi:SAM-dependent methyltransferase
VEKFLDAIGPGWVCDAVRRVEDPSYVENDLRHDVLSYVAPDDVAGAEVLDFGCGGGASAVVLNRLAPGARITGVELEAKFLDLARACTDWHGVPDCRFLLSPGAEALPEGIGPFDFILMSGVYEHLLPDERRRLMPDIWRLLKPGGVLFVSQTPHRWFPTEGHTTGLPFVNYVPDSVAHWAAHRLSPRIRTRFTWDELLRRGIRGGTPREIMNCLGTEGGRPVLLSPSRNGIADPVTLWSRSSAVRHSTLSHESKRLLLKAFWRLTNHALVPNLSLGIRKSP